MFFVVLVCHKPGLDGFDPLFQATIHFPAPLINLSNIDNFSSENFLGTLGIEPRAAVPEARMLPLCYAAPTYGPH